MLQKKFKFRIEILINSEYITETVIPRLFELDSDLDSDSNWFYFIFNLFLTLQVMMMHHCTKFDFKRLSKLENIHWARQNLGTPYFPYTPPPPPPPLNFITGGIRNKNHHHIWHLNSNLTLCHSVVKMCLFWLHKAVDQYLSRNQLQVDYCVSHKGLQWWKESLDRSQTVCALNKGFFTCSKA